jgi:mannose-6-phosphate isomerase-like protein (cupin superfamily)
MQRDLAMKEPTIFQPAADRPAYWLADHRMTLLIPGERTSNAYAVLEALVVPGGGPPPHIHHREDELFYVLEGDIAIRVGERTVRASAGTCVHVPSGAVHTFRNEGSRPARMVVQYAPAGFEKYFSTVGTPGAYGDETAPPVTQETLERFLAYAAQFNLEVLPPERG